ncbi:hypothetical protein PENSPDRAFT_65972 [Peniophora sp. CONT]|nr:hypothetical protein PENSPDRAFT_65972 [Peniophora sp. CONT]
MQPSLSIKLALPRPSLRPHLEPSVRDQPRMNLLPRATTFTAGRGAEKIIKSVSRVFRRSKSVSTTSSPDLFVARVVEAVSSNTSPIDATAESASTNEVHDEPASIFQEKASIAPPTAQAPAPVCRCNSCGSEVMHETNTIPFPSTSAPVTLPIAQTASTPSRPVLRRMPMMSFRALGLGRMMQRKLSSVTRLSSLMPSASFVTARTSISRSPSETSVHQELDGEAENFNTTKFPSNITDLSALMDTYLDFTPSDSWQSDAFWQLPPVSSTVLVSVSPAAPPSSPVPHAALVQDSMFLRPGPRTMTPQTVPGGSPFFGSMSAKSVRSSRSRTPRRRRVSGRDSIRLLAPTFATPPRGSVLPMTSV